MSLNNKSILVTGGAGFIGSHLVDALVKENPENLAVLSNFFLGKEDNLKEAREKYPKLRIYHGSAADYETIKRIIENEMERFPSPSARMELVRTVHRDLPAFSKFFDLNI